MAIVDMVVGHAIVHRTADNDLQKIAVLQKSAGLQKTAVAESPQKIGGSDALLRSGGLQMNSGDYTEKVVGKIQIQGKNI